MKLLFSLLLAVGVLTASEPWRKNPRTWTAADTERILSSSPWVQTAKAIFADDDVREPPPPGPLPGAAQAGMAGPRGGTDGHWDGGVGRMPRGSVPTLPILIRWDSALPVRQAAKQAREQNVVTDEQTAKDYVLTVIGLVPANRYRDAGQLSGHSRSDDTVDARDPEELLEGLMGSARLLRKGKPAITPENVKLDAATGALHIFFPRTNPISPADNEVTFKTQFGSMTVQKLFRLKDMTYNGHLEL